MQGGRSGTTPYIASRSPGVDDILLEKTTATEDGVEFLRTREKTVRLVGIVSALDVLRRKCYRSRHLGKNGQQRIEEE